MVRVEHANHIIEVQILKFEKGYTAWIKGDEYKGIVVESESLDECLKELSISLKVLELYRNNIKKEKL